MALAASVAFKTPLNEDSYPSIDPIQGLKIACAEEMNVLHATIEEHLKNDVPLLETVMKHLVLGGGKRLRPLLAIACYKALTPAPSQKMVELAAAIEFIHNATLLHDDVVDESQLRHGKASANILFGSKASILVGDFLFAKAFELMLGQEEKRVLPILAQVSQTITQGEVFQLGYVRTFDMPMDVLLHIIGTKTAALFAASAEIGAALLGQDSLQKDLHHYGKNLGITFQIIDDLLDYTGDSTVLGKSIGDDLREGKVTLPLYIAHRDGTAEQKHILEKMITQDTISEENLNSVLTILQSTQSAAKCLALAEDHALKALENLKKIQESPIKEHLQALPKKLLTRVQ